MQQIEQERNDKIMALFNNLNLEEHEQEFLDSGLDQTKMKSNDYGQSDYFNQTMVTNFDDELEQMQESVFDQNKQKKLASHFWSYLKEDVKYHQSQNAGLHSFLSKSDYHSHVKLQKLNIVCLKILDTFLSKNIAAINDKLLITSEQKISEDKYIHTMGSFLKKIKENRLWQRHMRMGS